MSKSPPFPYKLLIIRKEGSDWISAHVTVFEFAEDPTPSEFCNSSVNSSVLSLASCDSASLIFMESVLKKINDAPEMEGTGCKYTMAAVDFDKSDWNHRTLILKLVNVNEVSRHIINNGDVHRDGDVLTLHGLGTETPQSFD
ncbi:hypothetical protein TWF694_008946 [Orbilia ellipsospora]|uniref:Uncharacterized protein n=1 Tax=Orbilia ellipsospora TaxID=2528407 RepID=A0AAV9XE57_9PEZI